MSLAAYIITLSAFSDAQIPQAEAEGKLMMIFIGIAAISLLVLAFLALCAMIAIVLAGIKVKRRLRVTMAEVKEHAYPLIAKSSGLVGDLAPSIKGIAEKTHALLEDLSPKVSGITEDLHRISSSAREMADLANATAHTANEMAERQVKRVDGMLTHVLTWTSQIPLRLGRVLATPGKMLRK